MTAAVRSSHVGYECPLFEDIACPNPHDLLVFAMGKVLQVWMADDVRTLLRRVDELEKPARSR